MRRGLQNDSVSPLRSSQFSVGELVLAIMCCSAALALALELLAALPADLGRPQLSGFVREFDVGPAFVTAARKADAIVLLQREDTGRWCYDERTDNREYVANLQMLEGDLDGQLLTAVRSFMSAELEQRGCTVVKSKDAGAANSGTDDLHFSLTYLTPTTQGLIVVRVNKQPEERFVLLVELSEFPRQPDQGPQ